MKKIKVEFPYVKQNIIIDYGNWIKHLKAFIKKNKYDKILFLFDNSIFETYGNEFLWNFKWFDYNTIKLLPNNFSKDIDYLNFILKLIYNYWFSRKSVIVCIWWGYTSDLWWVLAWLYMRWVDFIQFSTTLMAQVDCVMWKVALNVVNKKNLVWLFNSPILTICDIKYLESLNKHELLLSFSEIFKHELINKNKKDLNIVLLILKNISNLLNDSISENIDKWEEIIYNSISIKKYFVENDPYDKNWLHKWLSLWHTIANVVESLIPTIRHWEAVWIWIYISLIISIDVYKNDSYGQILNEMERYFDFNYKNIKLKIVDILYLLENDKISNNWKISLVLFEKLGQYNIVNNITEKFIKKSFSNVFTIE